MNKPSQNCLLSDRGMHIHINQKVLNLLLIVCVVFTWNNLPQIAKVHKGNYKWIQSLVFSCNQKIMSRNMDQTKWYKVKNIELLNFNVFPANILVSFRDQVYLKITALFELVPVSRYLTFVKFVCVHLWLE